MQVAYIPMNSVKCGILTALYAGSIELPKSTEILKSNEIPKSIELPKSKYTSLEVLTNKVNLF